MKRAARSGIVLGLVVIAAGGVEAAVSIVADQARRNDAGLYAAIRELSAAAGASVAYRQTGAALPENDVILVGRPPDVPGVPLHLDKAEAFRIQQVRFPGRRAVVIEGDERGLMYGVFKLAERVALGEDPWSVELESAPAFPWRFFAEEGQLLDLPDLGYYSDRAPFADEARLRRETEELKRTVDHAARLGYNALAILHLGFEDYIDYQDLDQPVYSAGDRHRTRSPVFCKYLTELCDYAHARHLGLWLQVYELQYPPQLQELYGIDLNSPNMEKIVRAKTRELFRRVPLDGLYVTATETHPRCGYRSRTIWQREGARGAAKMITMFTEACRAVGKKVVFRLWRIAANAASARPIVENVPQQAVLDTKHTGVDFFLSAAAISDLVTSGLPKQRRFVVNFDAFGQYDGWSRLFCYQKRNAAAVRSCRDHGVMGINAWGDWAEGCIWPDWEPGYMLAAGGKPQTQKVSWAGYWNQFRMFTRGFSAGQANAYLLGRLAWDPDAPLEAITRDFCGLQVGSANAVAAAEALLVTQDGFQEEYLPGAHPACIRWTMTFNPRLAQLEDAYRRNPMGQVLASNARAIEAVEKMERAFARTDAKKAPDRRRYAEFKEAMEKTALYLRTFYLWREGWWRQRADRDLTGPCKTENVRALAAAKTKLAGLFEAWGRFPEEAGYWRVTHRYGRPQKGSSTDETFPSWYPRGDLTMESTAVEF